MFTIDNKENITFVENPKKNITYIRPELNGKQIQLNFKNETQVFHISPKDPAEAAKLDCKERKYGANLCFEKSESNLFPKLEMLENLIKIKYPDAKPLIKAGNVYLDFKKQDCFAIFDGTETDEDYSLMTDDGKPINDSNIHKVIKKDLLISGVCTLSITKSAMGICPKLKIDCIVVKPAKIININDFNLDF